MKNERVLRALRELEESHFASKQVKSSLRLKERRAVLLGYYLNYIETMPIEMVEFIINSNSFDLPARLI